MTLDAGIVRGDWIKAGWIDDVYARWMRNVLSTWPMAAFAPHVPFRDSLTFDIVIDGMAAIA
jgi:hypothetical protein